MSAAFARRWLYPGLALIVTLPLGAQIVGQQGVPQAVAPIPARAGANSGAAGSSAQLQSNIEFVLGKWDELQAEAHGGNHYVEDAIRHYRAAMAADPQSAYIASQLADLLSRLGRTAEALSLAQKTAAAHPESIAAHEALGEIYLRQLSDAPQPITDTGAGSALMGAVEAYKDLIRLDPSRAQYVVILGKLYGAEGKPALAEQQFRAALEVDPTSVDAVASLVQSLSSQNRLDEARKEIDSLPEVARGAQVYATLGDAYASHRRYADAAAAYRQALDADPQDPDLRKAMASALMDGGNYPAALGAYQQLRQQLPDDGQVALRLGQLQMQMNQLDAARGSLTAAAKLLPSGNLEVAYATALLDQSQGKDQIAVKELQSLAERNTPPATRSIFLEQLARLQMRMGDYAGAETQLQQLEGLGASYRERALGLEIQLYAEQRDYPHALASAKAALAAEPDSRSLQVTYANLLAASGNIAGARAAIQPLLRGHAGDWDLYLALGQVEMQGREWKQAIADTRKADALVTTASGHARAARQLGLIEARQSDFNAAEESYRRALQLEPNDAETLNALGYLLAERGVRLQEALGYVQQAVAQDGHNGAYLDSLGWIYFKMNRLPQAVSSLEQAANYDRHDPAILDHLAQAYEGDGKLEQAASSWTQALADLKLNSGQHADRQRQQIQKRLAAVKVRIAQERQ